MDFKEIEAKWAKFWEEHPELSSGVDNDTKRKKFYVLVEFPYPSGAGLHIGHARSWTAMDIYSRKKRMEGYNVMYPIGWDAFGLPAENYALKLGVHPSKIVPQNIAKFKEQCKAMGLSFDWNREIDTTDPKYYKWTQWIFLQLYKKGLAKRMETQVNWCPFCKTTLANEEVNADGTHERCGKPTEKKTQKQWVIKITEYADRLIDDLKLVDYSPNIAAQQVKWIGKSEGARVKFRIKKEKTVLMIDGFGGDGTSNWFPWLKNELEKQGCKVLNPNLPNNETPDYQETMLALKNLLKENKVKNLSIVAHSLGAVTVCALITELKLKMDKLIFVAPADINTSVIDRNEKVFGKEAIEVISKYLNEAKIDWKTINDLSKNNFLYFSDNDPYISKEIEEQYKNLTSTVRHFPNKGHFNEKAGVVELPEILNDINESLEVFTTRPDTLFGATFMVVAPEHKLVSEINSEEVKNYVISAGKKSEMERTELNKEKTGVFSGLYAINPATGKEIPIWISDFVLVAYGTGAIMAVPAHDERDMEFAKKYGLEIISVIEPITGEKHDNEEFRKSIVAIVKNPKNGKLLSINWGNLGGNLFIGGGIECSEDLVKCAEREISEETGYKNLKFIEQSEKIHHHYFAASKNIYREIEATGLLFELIDEEREETKLEDNEKDKFKVEWISEEEAEKKVTDRLHKYVFNKFIKRMVYAGEGMMTNSGVLNGLTPAEAFKKMIEWLVDMKIGEKTNSYHLRDWIFSRQHYWGEPIPIIHCEKCGEVPVPEDQLPVELPYVEKYEPSGTGESPLANITEWVNTACPKCGEPARRETDTMPNWAGSNWYYVRYLDRNNDKELAAKEKMKYWLPVDIYQGGFEHTTLHLLYSRFIYKFLYDIGVVPGPEPYAKRRSHGIVLGADGNKMSKSFGNVINPEDVINRIGADALRVYEMFMGPFDQMVAWSDESASGCQRFLLKTFTLFKGKVAVDGKENSDLSRKLNKTINKVESDIENFKFNTTISTMMEFVNAWQQSEEGLTKEQAKSFLKLLAPFAPFMAEEVWGWLKDEKEPISVFLTNWPKVEEKYLVEEEITIAVAVNGKVREQLVVKSEDAENREEVIKKAKELLGMKKWLEDKEVMKEFYVPGKMINLVLK